MDLWTPLWTLHGPWFPSQEVKMDGLYILHLIRYFDANKNSRLPICMLWRRNVIKVRVSRKSKIMTLVAAQLRRWDSCQVLVKNVFAGCWTDVPTDLSFKAETTAAKRQP